MQKETRPKKYITSECDKQAEKVYEKRHGQVTKWFGCDHINKVYQHKPESEDGKEKSKIKFCNFDCPPYSSKKRKKNLPEHRHGSFCRLKKEKKKENEILDTYLDLDQEVRKLKIKIKPIIYVIPGYIPKILKSKMG